MCWRRWFRDPSPVTDYDGRSSPSRSSVRIAWREPEINPPGMRIQADAPTPSRWPSAGHEAHQSLAGGIGSAGAPVPCDQSVATMDAVSAGAARCPTRRRGDALPSIRATAGTQCVFPWHDGRRNPGWDRISWVLVKCPALAGSRCRDAGMQWGAVPRTRGTERTQVVAPRGHGRPDPHGDWGSRSGPHS